MVGQLRPCQGRCTGALFGAPRWVLYARRKKLSIYEGSRGLPDTSLSDLYPSGRWLSGVSMTSSRLSWILQLMLIYYDLRVTFMWLNQEKLLKRIILDLWFVKNGWSWTGCAQASAENVQRREWIICSKFSIYSEIYLSIYLSNLGMNYSVYVFHI